ncbi:MAG: peroxiredoxin family protein [Aureliella sp.]
MKSGSHLGTTFALTLILLAPTTNLTQAQTQKESPASPAELQAAKCLLGQLANAESQSNFTALRRLMTDSAWDEFCRGRIQEAIIVSSGEFGNNKALANVLKKYDIDAAPAPDAVHGEDLLASLKAPKRRMQMLEEIKSALTKPSGMGPDGAILQMIEISPFRGNIESSIRSGNHLYLELKPEPPPMLVGPGSEFFELRSGDALPPGLDVQDAPFGSEEFEFSSDLEKELGPEIDVELAGLPLFNIDLLQVNGQWKCNGLSAAIDDSELLRSHPTIESPDFNGQSADGRSIRLKDYRGKLVMLDFWGTWCKGCIAEFPKLKKLHAALEDENFILLGVAQDSLQSVAKYTEEHPLPWSNIIDDGKICNQFRINVFPTTIFIDEEGHHFASNLHGAKLVEELTTRLDLSAKKTRELATAMGLSKREVEKLLHSISEI